MGNRNSGRRPKATALKLLRGNPGKRPLNQAEPQPPVGDVGKPAHLSPGASVVWDDLAPICLAMGTLTMADGQSFATLCELVHTREQASAHKAQPDFSLFLYTTVVDGAGNEHPQVKVHPAIKLEGDTAVKLRPYFEKFGLEPVGRARMHVAKPKQPEDKWAGRLA